MEIFIFWGIMLLVMIIDDRQVKKDIKASRNIKFTKKDAEQYYNFTKSENK